MKKRRLKKSAKIFFVVLSVVIVLLIIILLLPKKKIYMESFVGKEIGDIEEFCKEKCTIEVKEEFNSEYEEGKIINQSVKEKEEIKKNTKIIVTISKGIDYQTLKASNINELGRIPVMMYHGIINKTNDETSYTGGNVDKDGYQRTVEAFRNDLEFYYKSGYRMIRLIDYVNGKIDTEFGKSPIVLTFDDGLANNIKVTGLDDNGNIIIDPNSAVGVLEEFKNKYPDFNVTATFFITGSLFNQKGYNDKIIEFLINNGYDIGNHTYSHADLTKTSEEGTIKEVGSMYNILRSKTDKFVNIVALPYGTPYNSTHINFKHVLSGVYEGEEYNTVSSLRVGWESDYSPFSTSFTPNFIKRIRAYDNNGLDFDIEYNFKYLETRKYISDGNPSTIVVKEADLSKIKETNLKIISY